jgi:hypothetical protein
LLERAERRDAPTAVVGSSGNVDIRRGRSVRGVGPVASKAVVGCSSCSDSVVSQSPVGIESRLTAEVYPPPGVPSVPKYYAVLRGYNWGVFYSWEECEWNMKGYSGAKFYKLPILSPSHEVSVDRL